MEKFDPTYQDGHRTSRFLKALVGVDESPSAGQERAKCLLCGKRRSKRYHRSSTSSEVCSRPGCDLFFEHVFASDEPGGKPIVLEIHHYLHSTSPYLAQGQPDVPELSGEGICMKRIEMPENNSRRVTRAMSRRPHPRSHDDPPRVCKFTKPMRV